MKQRLATKEEGERRRKGERRGETETEEGERQRMREAEKMGDVGMGDVGRGGSKYGRCV